jgi:adenylylsulfate kinase-like enzyme
LDKQSTVILKHAGLRGAGHRPIAGMSGGGKSTVAAGLLERVFERGIQFCLIDPEGDYAELKNTVSLGDANCRAAPTRKGESRRSSRRTARRATALFRQVFCED